MLVSSREDLYNKFCENGDWNNAAKSENTRKTVNSVWDDCELVKL